MTSKYDPSPDALKRHTDMCLAVQELFYATDKTGKMLFAHISRFDMSLTKMNDGEKDKNGNVIYEWVSYIGVKFKPREDYLGALTMECYKNALEFVSGFLQKPFCISPVYGENPKGELVGMQISGVAKEIKCPCARGNALDCLKPLHR